MKKTISTIVLVTIIINSIFAQRNCNFFLIFSARGASIKPTYSFTGHAFVTWLQRKSNNDSIIASKTLGFFPEHDASLSDAISGVNAEVGDGYDKNCKGVPSDHIMVEVDSLTWVSTMQASKEWEKTEYSLLRKNCVTFVNAIAKRAGLLTPKTTIQKIFPRTPKTYLKKLLHLNKRKAKKIAVKELKS